MSRSTTDGHTIDLMDGLSVSRETYEALKWYANEIERWQKGQNLISSKTLDNLWLRHIVDSAQILIHAPSGKAPNWLDLGSGAGLPAIVIAILLKDQPSVNLRLVESNAKKCTFLRHCIKSLDLNASVFNERLERLNSKDMGDVDVVTARALTSLNALLVYSSPWLQAGAIALFHKGEKVEEELANAARDWQFDVKCHRSLTSSNGVILEIRDLRSNDQP